MPTLTWTLRPSRMPPPDRLVRGPQTLDRRGGVPSPVEMPYRAKQALILGAFESFEGPD